MYNSQYYTCEQIDERLLQGYLDDYNTQTGQSLTKEQFLTKLGNVFAKETVIDNTAVNIGYFVCDTAAGTAAKAITAVGYALFAGGSMKVKFANKNTANNATLNINSQGAKALYYQGERASATNSWDAEEVVEIYYDGTSYYANNVIGGSGSGVYDVSVEHPTAGPNGDGKFTLDYILNYSNVNDLIPVNKRRPGMTIQFVSTSDNKYVQYRLMADEWSINTEDWAIADEGVYIENPEFAYVQTDKDDKILWAIKVDGSIYYGAGCPKQVKDYIEEKISSLSLDEYDDIVAFLSDYLGSDTTLKVMLDSINERIPKFIDNPELVEAKTDNEGKLLEARKVDGTKVEYCNLQVKGNIINEGIQGQIDTAIQDMQEEVEEVLASAEETLSYFESVENFEWIETKTDIEGKILEGRKVNGNKVEYCNVEYPNGIPSEIREYVDAHKEISDNINGYYNLKSDSDFSKLNATIIREGNNPCFSFNRKNGDCLYIHLKVKFPIDVHDVNGDFNILDVVDTDGIGKHYNAFLRKSITSVRTENPKYPIPVYKAGIYTAYDGTPLIWRDWRTYLVPDNLDRCLLFGGDAMSIRFTGDCSVTANQDIMFESTDSVFRILHSTNDSTIISYDKSLYPTMRDFYNKIAQDIEDNVLVDYEVEFFNLDDYTPYDVINCKVHLVAPYQAESGGAYNTFKSYPYYFTTKDTKKQIYDLEFVFEKNSVSGGNSNIQLIINGYGIHLGNAPEWLYSQYLFNNDVTITIGERNSDAGVEILSMEVSDTPNFKYTNLRMLYAESMGTDGIRNPQSGYFISPDHLANISNSLKENGFGYTKFQNILEYLRGSKVFGKDNIWHFRQDDSSWNSIMVEKNLETCLSKNIVSSFGILLHTGITEDKIAKAKTLIPLGFEWYPHTAFLPNDPTIGGGQIGLGLLDYDDFKAAIDASIAKFVELFGFRPIVWDFHTVNDGGYNTSAYLRNHGFELILRQTGRGLITSINRYGCKGYQLSDVVTVNSLTAFYKDGNYINDPAITFVDDVPEELN